ncbi:MAG TPA: DUF2914 domain-containing protein [Gammaproteobacteria bacterium]|nr:DUF2914 domain-containing protein [Gammaproteobacteria bacterium]
MSFILLITILSLPVVALAEVEPFSEQDRLAADPAAEVIQSSDGVKATDEASMASLGRVARSAFTQTIIDREPQDQIISLSNDQDAVYYFTEIRDMSGQEITHRWLYNARVMAEVSFQIGSNRWRVWSKKYLVSGWTGLWTVEVVDQAGTIIHSDIFTYTDAELP